MATRPNIILIITEQHRGDCLSIDDHPVLMTPNIDNLAASGARFRRAYTSCPSCIAARRSLLTGQFPRTHGMVGYRDHVPWQTDVVLLPEALRAAGYHTCITGRDMHQKPERQRRGFDHMVLHHDWIQWLETQVPDAGGWRGSGVMNNDYTAYPWPHADHLHATNWTVERALDFLRDRDPACPFFLTVSFLAAHPPLQPPAPYFDRYVRTGVPEPHIGDWETPPPDRGLGLNVGGHAAVLKGETLLSARAGYYGLINHLDDQVHRLLYPAVSGIDFNDTIVMLVSDHGEMLGDHYRWHKTVAYEGSARIPFMLRAPARFGIDAGTVLDNLVCLEDVMPTLLDMAGVDIPATVEGASLLPVMRSGGGAVRDRLHIEHAPSQHGMTDGREKYIWHADTGREQFFDLAADPNELHDRIGDADAQGRIAAWRAALIETLTGRPEGFTDGDRLIPGRPYRPVLPHALPEGYS